MNHSDNPWFPQTLELERQADQARLPEAEYLHVWEGFCKPAVEGAIYFNEIAKAEAARRIRNVPMDPALKVHRVWDMGWNDAMAVILAQRCGSEIAIVGYVTGQYRTTADYIAEFKGERYRGWNWGHDFLPHDGFSKSRQTGLSDADVLTGLGCSVRQTPNIEVEQGIRNARLVFPRVYIDRENTKAPEDSELPGLVECLKRYRRQLNQQGTAGNPLHDVYSNGADAFRYLCLNVEAMTNEDFSEDDSEGWGDDGRSSVGGY
jgi:phage terminase large subunit